MDSDPTPPTPTPPPSVILDEDDLGTLGYLAWLHHAMWCPARLAQIGDPLTHFRDLDERMTARADELTAGLPATSNETWQTRRETETQVVAQMGMPPREVDQPVWVPEDADDEPDGPLAQMTDVVNLLDEAIQAVRDDRDPSPALAELDRLHTTDRD